MTCRASALQLLLPAVQLGSFPLQLLLLPQQVGLSASSRRLEEENKNPFRGPEDEPGDKEAAAQDFTKYFN